MSQCYIVHFASDSASIFLAIYGYESTIGVARIFYWGGGSCKFSPLTSFTLDDISHG